MNNGIPNFAYFLRFGPPLIEYEVYPLLHPTFDLTANYPINQRHKTVIVWVCRLPRELSGKKNPLEWFKQNNRRHFKKNVAIYYFIQSSELRIPLLNG